MTLSPRDRLHTRTVDCTGLLREPELVAHPSQTTYYYYAAAMVVMDSLDDDDQDGVCYSLLDDDDAQAAVTNVDRYLPLDWTRNCPSRVHLQSHRLPPRPSQQQPRVVVVVVVRCARVETPPDLLLLTVSSRRGDWPFGNCSSRPPPPPRAVYFGDFLPLCFPLHYEKTKIGGRRLCSTHCRRRRRRH